MRWWWNSNHYIRWWHNMEACLLFCLGPSHRDNRPPARLYSYYCPHQALMKIYLHKYKILSIVLPFESDRYIDSTQKHNSVSSQLFSQDANSEEKEKSNYWEMLDAPYQQWWLQPPTVFLRQQVLWKFIIVVMLTLCHSWPGLLSNSSCFNTLGPCGWYIKKNHFIYHIYRLYFSWSKGW